MNWSRKVLDFLVASYFVFFVFYVSGSSLAGEKVKIASAVRLSPIL